MRIPNRNVDPKTMITSLFSSNSLSLSQTFNWADAIWLNYRVKNTFSTVYLDPAGIPMAIGAWTTSDMFSYDQPWNEDRMTVRWDADVRDWILSNRVGDDENIELWCVCQQRDGLCSAVL